MFDLLLVGFQTVPQNMGEVVTEATGALTTVLPSALVTIFVAAGAALAIAVRFGRRIISMGR